MFWKLTFPFQAQTLSSGRYQVLCKVHCKALGYQGVGRVLPLPVATIGLVRMVQGLLWNSLCILLSQVILTPKHHESTTITNPDKMGRKVIQATQLLREEARIDQRHSSVTYHVRGLQVSWYSGLSVLDLKQYKTQKHRVRCNKDMN